MNEFDDIIGYDATKEELVRIADTLKNAERYRKLGMASPRGLILYGRPGTGKTLMATASSRQAGALRSPVAVPSRTTPSSTR